MITKSIGARTATIALTAAALTVPNASARPIDPPPAATRPHQDLRSPDAVDAATRRTAPWQDLRLPDTVDAATRPPEHARASATQQDSGDIDATWPLIGAGLLALSLVGVVGGHARRGARLHA
jgi:hypothetical protein